MIVTDDARVAELCHSTKSGGDRWAHSMSRRNGRRLWDFEHRYNYLRRRDQRAAWGSSRSVGLDEILARTEVAREATSNVSPTASTLSCPRSTPRHGRGRLSSSLRLATTYALERQDRIIKDATMKSARAITSPYPSPFYREQFGFEPGMFPIANP